MNAKTAMTGEQATTFCISRLEQNVESACVLRMIEGHFSAEDILDIECGQWDSTAHVTFKNRTLAEVAIKQYHDQRSNIRGHRLEATVVSGHIPNEKNLFLSKFLRDEEARKDLKTLTIRVEQLPDNHTRKSLNLLLDNFFIMKGGEHVEPGDECVESTIGVSNDEYRVAYL